jgi:PBSX family phage portal protein
MMRSDDGPAPEVEVSLGTIYTKKGIMDETDDPFLATGSEVKKLGGVSPALKRKTTRELQKVHAGTEGAESKKIDVEDVTGYLLFDVVVPPYNLEYLARLNELSSPHYAAIKAKVANIVGLGYDFVESQKTKQALDEIKDEEKTAKARRKLAKAKNELLDWLDSCNQDDEFVETLIKVWTDYEATGNGYLEIGRKTNGEIGYIGHIPATAMRVRKQRDGFVQIMQNKAVFFRNFGDRRTTDKVGNDPRPNEVLHFKRYSPTNNYYGIPDIIAAQQAIAGNEFSARFNLDYFENKAVPRYVVVVKGGSLSAGAQRNILEFFQTDLKGKNHRTLFVPLPADEQDRKTSFEMKPVESGTQDASFINYNEANLRDILMAHGVPIGKVTHQKNASLAASRDADKTFKEQRCRPEQKIAEKKLNKVIKEVSDIFELKLNELTLTDEDTLSKMDERYLRWGVIVPNEVRARWGWTGIKDGDKPVGMMQQTEAMNEAKASIASEANAARAEQAAQANQSRTRDAARSAGATDSAGEGRSTKGDGRTTP